MRLIIFSILGFTLLLSGCKDTFVIQKATSQIWWGGVEGSGGGKKYRVLVTKPAKAGFVVERVWIGDREKGRLFKKFSVYNPVERKEFTDKKVPAGVKEFGLLLEEIYPGSEGRHGDLEHGGQRNVSPEQPPVQQAPEDLPQEYSKGGIVFLTYDGGKTGWFQFPEIEALETQAMP
ncbi:MAG: hypothetical protein H6581_00065 [Bacteroidia bacterium]|nr:hypothetical protein [Bacteroidia bacterium]